MAEKRSPEYIFETSWEVCNMVGGIYTVLSTRAATLQKKCKDKLMFIGPDVWLGKNNPLFVQDNNLLLGFEDFTLREYNLAVRVGRWNIPGKPVAILVDFMPLMLRKDEIYGHVWNLYKVNSMPSYGDYDESSMFGYATGMIMESFYRFAGLTPENQVVAHFNEWMTTFGAFYVNEHLPQVATIFTTHATSIGRSIAGNHKPLYDYLNEYNGDQMAYELNMVSKHSTEKAGTQIADCFTTVSEITAVECAQLLERVPDVVTPNGFENDFVPKGKTFVSKRNEAKTALRNVAETLLGYKLDDNAFFVGTAGRYEYKNKGIDTFIEALKHLYDHQNTTRQLVAFIMVPAWVKGPRVDLQQALQKPDAKFYTYNRTTTHELHEYYNDSVMGALNWFHMFNQENERVKVIFVPSYLNGVDGIFNKTYYDLLIGLDLTVFPSYYEPWGYTPLESVAFAVPTITTGLSGFGQWVSKTPLHVSEGVGVIARSDYNAHEVALQIAEMIDHLLNCNANEMEIIRNKASEIASKALWKHFIKYYDQAYEIALRNKEARNKLASS